MDVCSCSIASKKSTNALLPSADGLVAAGVDDEDCLGVLEPLADGDFLPGEADLDVDSIAANNQSQMI